MLATGSVGGRTRNFAKYVTAQLSEDIVKLRINADEIRKLS